MKVIKTTEAVGHVLCHDLTQIIPGEFKGKGNIIFKAFLQAGMGSVPGGIEGSGEENPVPCFKHFYSFRCDWYIYPVFHRVLLYFTLSIV